MLINVLFFTLKNVDWSDFHWRASYIFTMSLHLVQSSQQPGGHDSVVSFSRCFHHLIWMSHAGFLYVDDFLFFMDASMMPLAAVLLCIFSQITGSPHQLAKNYARPLY